MGRTSIKFGPSSDAYISALGAAILAVFFGYALASTHHYLSFAAGAMIVLIFWYSWATLFRNYVMVDQIVICIRTPLREIQVAPGAIRGVRELSHIILDLSSGKCIKIPQYSQMGFQRSARRKIGLESRRQELVGQIRYVVARAPRSEKASVTSLSWKFPSMYLVLSSVVAGLVLQAIVW